MRNAIIEQIEEKIKELRSKLPGHNFEKAVLIRNEIKVLHKKLALACFEDCLYNMAADKNIQAVDDFVDEAQRIIDNHRNRLWKLSTEE